MRKLLINKENKTKFLGIGGENRRDKPYVLPTGKKNLITVGPNGKLQHGSVAVAPRETKNNHFGFNPTPQHHDIHIPYEEAAIANILVEDQEQN